MLHTLNLNQKGELNGFQTIRYTINGQTIIETQYFRNGEWKSGFMTVSGVGRTIYTFRTEQWGTMEIVRNAAEEFAADDLFNVVLVDGWTSLSKFVFPSNELALI